VSKYDPTAGICFNARKNLFKRKIEPQSHGVLRAEMDRSPMMGHVRPVGAYGIKIGDDVLGNKTDRSVRWLVSVTPIRKI
jgi:hypothetical protein